MQGVWALAVVLLWAGCAAQSGDSDAESRVSCSSHIMIGSSSLTCKLLGGGSSNEDDEDEEADSIERITMCFTDDWSSNTQRCVQGLGDTVSSSDLSPLVPYNVTVHLRRGGAMSITVDLKKIVKPRSPQVFNVSFSPESHLALFHIRTPYHREYLKVDNQLFQLLIWSADRTTTQNVSSSDTLKVDMEHLQANTRYHVRVRAIPLKHLQGSWSEWSDTFTFLTPAEERVYRPAPKQPEERQQTYGLIVCLVALLLVTSCVVFFWKIRIIAYMWPSIPRPKHTLVQICRHNKGLLLNFKPEEFSSLKVSPKERSEEQPCEETEHSTPPDSTQTSDCSSTSANTEELELSALLSRSSSDREDSLQINAPSHDHVLHAGQRPSPPPPEGSGGHQVEVFAVSQQEEAYVTMSSFYQIK
uniref:interleukin-7 receptor subunit alpha-like n=1 Tax=Semicossyphus pulcher TaxID=241346 RepID=UPI0037E8B828